MMRNVQPTRQWGCEVVERDRHDDGAEAQDEYQLQLPNRGDQGHYQCDDQDLANETGLGVALRLLGYLLVHCAPVALRPPWSTRVAKRVHTMRRRPPKQSGSSIAAWKRSIVGPGLDKHKKEGGR